jgi:hypothetical protein
VAEEKKRGNREIRKRKQEKSPQAEVAFGAPIRLAPAAIMLGRKGNAVALARLPETIGWQS